jgi:hypothetical protein
VLVGVSQPLGHALGWPGLRNLGMVSGASPLPLVFNAVNGYEYWAATYKLDLQLAQGEWRSLAVDSATFAGLPGPHRFHMVLTFPFMAGPILPERFWTGLLQYGLCHSGPLAAARAVPAEVRAGTIEIATANRPAWRGGFVCPR